MKTNRKTMKIIGENSERDRNTHENRCKIVKTIEQHMKSGGKIRNTIEKHRKT